MAWVNTICILTQARICRRLFLPHSFVHTEQEVQWPFLFRCPITVFVRRSALYPPQMVGFRLCWRVVIIIGASSRHATHSHDILRWNVTLSCYASHVYWRRNCMNNKSAWRHERPEETWGWSLISHRGGVGGGGARATIIVGKYHYSISSN